MSPALLVCAAAIAAPPEPVRDLKLPPGFTARLYADNPLAPDIYTMTMDDEGRVLAAGRGYVRVLVDDDGDGYADRAIDLIDGLKDGPMGLLAEGDSLFVVSDGGLKRYRGYNGTDKLKGPETLLAVKTFGEHDAHAVRRGPDGWLYLLCGNSTGIRKETITGERSPVKDPIAGTLVRLSPDFKTVEVVAEGFRNPYSFDFNLDGDPFTYDSDNERCVGLPWHEGCRFYHIVPGGSHGWRSPQLSQTWRKPPYFPDVVPPICDTGRGSPTGVACYRHSHFPENYRGGFFLADWTFGRIYHVPLKATGSSYSGKHAIFAESTGTSGFAPTALAVHPKTGELFVSIGGRGTRGAVYRVTYDKAKANPKPLAMAKRSLDFDKAAADQWLADCKSEDARARRTALDRIARWWDKVPWGAKLDDAVKVNLSHDDRLVRWAAGRLTKSWGVKLGELNDPQAQITFALEQAADPEESLKTALRVIASEDVKPALRLEAARAIQLTFGDLTAKDSVGTVFEGFTFRKPPTEKTAARVMEAIVQYRSTLADARKPPPPAPELDRELGRIAAGLRGGEPATARRTARWMCKKLVEWPPRSDVRDDLHYLACLARFDPEDIADEGYSIATGLLWLEAKRIGQDLGADRHWGLRITELAAALLPDSPALSDAVIAHGKYGELSHLRLVKYLKPSKPDTGPAQLARGFLDSARRYPDSPFAPLLFEYLPQLSRGEIAPVLDAFWERPHLRDSVLRVVASKPLEGDQLRLVVGLQSLDSDVVRLSAKALAGLKKPEGGGALVAAVKALRRLPDEKPNAEARAELVTLLQKHSGQKIGADAMAWAAWVVKSDPASENILNASDGFDAAAWEKRLRGIGWDKGDAERGRAAFAKATCASCHDRAGAIGPSLLGVAKRFSRDDLLTAILRPGKDISPRYRPTRVVTTDDKTYTGILVYEAPDSVIVQTNADTLVRLAGKDVASKQVVDVSLMPAGLIDKLGDDEVADLLAYLRSLGDPK